MFYAIFSTIFNVVIWACGLLLGAFALWVLVTAKPEWAVVYAIVALVFWYMTRPEKQD